jgi:hypothetical protein
MIREGDKFRIVESFGDLKGKKFVCSARSKFRVNGHELYDLIEFKAPDYQGKLARYAIPQSWCMPEPKNGPATRKRV